MNLRGLDGGRGLAFVLPVLEIELALVLFTGGLPLTFAWETAGFATAAAGFDRGALVAPGLGAVALTGRDTPVAGLATAVGLAGAGLAGAAFVVAGALTTGAVARLAEEEAAGVGLDAETGLVVAEDGFETAGFTEGGFVAEPVLTAETFEAEDLLSITFTGEPLCG